VRGIIRTEPRSQREDEEVERDETGAAGGEGKKKKTKESKQKKDRGPVVSDLNLRYRVRAATVPREASLFFMTT
jgi:hypothetical protein